VLRTATERSFAGGWGAVVPAKTLKTAKTRLRSLGRARTAELVTAMFEDTLLALSESHRVDQLVVVTNDEILTATAARYGARTVPDPGLGLNEAFFAGMAALRPRLRAIAYLPADLPCLTGTLVDATLEQAGQYDVAVVPDAAGGGSALFTHRVGWKGMTRFGENSLQRHVDIGAVPLWSADPAVRCDVDVAGDLVEAVRIGAGRHTTDVCSRFLNRWSA